MAPGCSAQKRRKEMEARRERRAAEVAAEMAAAAAQATATVAVESARTATEAGTMVPIPSLAETDPSAGVGASGGGADLGSGCGDAGSGGSGGAAGGAAGVVEERARPLSIRTKRGPQEPELVNMATGEKVNGRNPDKPGIITGTKTLYLVSLNGGKPLKVDYSERHRGPALLKWRTLMSRDIGSAIRSRVPMLAPSYAELAEEHRDALTTYLEMFYDLPATEIGMWRYIDETAAKIYKDWKYDCHTHYVEVSKATPAEFIHRPEQWEYLKVHFEDDDYKKMCARNAANRNKAKEKGCAVNHHSGTTPYSYRVVANEERGSLAPILQTVCDVYAREQNAQEKVAAVKRKMDELCASRAADVESGSQATGPATVEEQIAVVDECLGGTPGTRVRGLGGALRRPAKPRGGARVSSNDSEVEQLRAEVAAANERVRINEERHRIEQEENRIEKEEMLQRMARMEAALGFSTNPNAAATAAATAAAAAARSSCAEGIGATDDDLE